MTSSHTARDVFISYAGCDRDAAARLADSLGRTDVSIWWDACLSADQPFERQIQHVLAGTKVIVAVLSREALASEWVRWELSQAAQNGLHVVPLLVKGLQQEELPPPLHLLASVTIAPDGHEASFDAAAARIRALVRTIRLAPPRRTENDARRRLASAAADTARQAAHIKERKSQSSPRPPVIVNNFLSADEQTTLPASYTASEGFASFLRSERISLAFSSCQADRLFLLGCAPGGELMLSVEHFRRPTGLHASDGTLLLATLGHLHRLENILDAGQLLDATYSHCFVPRVAHLTGVLDIHDLSVNSDGDVLFVATRFNCLGALSRTHGFALIWRPYFISEIVAEDRCHLNGLAMRRGAPAYATALAATNVYGGWRNHAARGGIVIDVPRNAIVCRDLSMPHSPRMHADSLWLLNSGSGELGYVDNVDSASGRFTPVAFCPGFARGLAFHRQHAIVGVSLPRHDHFDGLALGGRLAKGSETPWCGLLVIEVASGRCAHWLRIEGSVRELSDVAVLEGAACPRSVSDQHDEALELITIEARSDVGASSGVRR
jgi:uncharacterized protein (TIGR03032 family)